MKVDAAWVWTLPRIEAADIHRVPRLRPHQLEACALVEAHGHDPHDVSWVEYDLLDAPMLRFGCFVRDPYSGYVMKDPDCGGPLMRTCEHILKGELPRWWQPDLAGAGTECGS